MAGDQRDEEKAPRGVSAHALRRSDHPALVFGDTVRSYGELEDRARRLAGWLLDSAADATHPVAVVVPNGVEPFEVAVAADMAKVPYLPVNWHLKAAEIGYLLRDADVGAVVGHAELTGELGPALEALGRRLDTLVVGEGATGEGTKRYEEVIADFPADPALVAGPGPQLVFYTSGTTSRPKGVVHGGLEAREARAAGMEGQVALWGWSADDVYVLCGPAYHASHGGWALAALWVGATTVVLPRFSALGWLSAIERHRGTRSFMVPAHFIRVLELSDEERHSYDTSSLRLIVHGAAPCPVPVKRRMIEAFPEAEIHELYGASEGGATRISPTEWLERPGSVGRPWPGVEIRVLDAEGRPLGPGEEGVVWIRPPNQHTFEYRNDPEATSRAWRDGAFSVGDVGFLDADGYLTITDRVSDMILWGGVNVAPREIEEVLFEHRAVVDCAVFGVPDERDGEHIKAIVEVRAEVDPQELADHVRSKLADYKVPHVIELVDHLPRDPNGKVVKRMLRRQG